MRKTTRLYVLLGVLAVLCAAVFAVEHYEEKKEQIKTSGEVVLAIPADSVTALSWSSGDGTLSFTRDDDGWHYDGDAAFPVEEDCIADMLAPLEALSAAFVIEDVDDYSPYGLDTPVCTVTLTADGTEHVLRLGDLSKMDGQRYLSFGDGNAYLAVHDLMEEFDAVLSELLRDDTIPAFETVTRLTFRGTESYTAVRDETRTSLCADDVYFVDEQPLDTSLVESYLATLGSLRLSSFVSYNASDEELSAYGLSNPEQSICAAYTTQSGETGEFTLHLARNPGELLSYNEAVHNGDETLPDVTCYARLGDSRIVYQLTQSLYSKLTAVSCDTLRHQSLFPGDTAQLTAIDITLDGAQYTLSRVSDEEATWCYQDSEFDAQALLDALSGLTASAFTDEDCDGQTELALTLHLEREDFPTFSLVLRRYDGESCHAAVDGENTALVSRAQTVALIEAIYAVVLN